MMRVVPRLVLRHSIIGRLVVVGVVVRAVGEESVVVSCGITGPRPVAILVIRVGFVGLAGVVGRLELVGVVVRIAGQAIGVGVDRVDPAGGVIVLAAMLEHNPIHFFPPWRLFIDRSLARVKLQSPARRKRVYPPNNAPEDVNITPRSVR